MKIGLYQPKDRLRWEDYVKSAAASTLYHHIGWKEIVEKSFGQKTYYWYAEDRLGHIRGFSPPFTSRAFSSGILWSPFRISITAVSAPRRIR
ncbi:MAG: hypothetical protein MPW17_07720 [Candidatus Manganitrophus sp.]|nr:MAG: hypothetical protein MPW17_07720 [Candidatus Manganitrophus sp.]